MVLSLGFAEYANRSSSAAAPATTISRVELLIPPEMAAICGLPTATPVACPALAIVASVVSELLQDAVAVMSEVLPSLKVPLAANCCFLPTATEGLDGVT